MVSASRLTSLCLVYRVKPILSLGLLPDTRLSPERVTALRFDGGVVLRDLEVKERARAEIESLLDPGELREALRDGHARRKARPCGLTIHTSTGCGYGCLYCYIFDMGFSPSPRPYPLSGYQLVYALLRNENFIAGRYGTLLAFGSVTEPFMDVAREKTLEYLESTSRLLGNPQQISVKGVLDESALEEFVARAERDVDVLVSITTLKKARVLEPGAPPPEARLDFARELAKRGVSVALFVRPIIPSVTDSEFSDILEEAAKRGLRRVVLGSLRVTSSILRRLEASRALDIVELEKRLPVPRGGLRSGEQVAIRASDIKDKLASVAEARGFKVYPSACSSSIDAHRLYCRLCWMGPCGIETEKVEVEEAGVVDAAETLKARVDVRVSKSSVDITCLSNKRACEKLKLYIETVAKVRARLRFKF